MTNYSSFNGTLDVDTILGIHGVTSFDMIMKIVFYVLAIVMALFGNLSIIVIIIKTKSLRTKFNFYIVNLAVADTLIALTCMWIHLVNSMDDQWLLGSFLCKIHTFVQVTSVCSSVITLTTVTVDRFLAIVAPAYLWITQKCQVLTIIIIWLVALGIAAPWVVFSFYAEFDWVGGHEMVCQSRFPSVSARRVYYVLFFILLFLLPVLLMLTLIVLSVIKTDTVRPNGQLPTEAFRTMQRKAIYMVLTVVILFCVCWTPQQSLLLWDVYRDIHEKPHGIKNLHYIALYVAYSSSAINPIIYCVFNKCFRHSFYSCITCRTNTPRHANHVTVHPAAEDNV